EDRCPAGRFHLVREPRASGQGHSAERHQGSDGGQQPAGIPLRRRPVEVSQVQGVQGHSGRRRVEQHLPADLHVVRSRKSRLGRRLAPYLLILPGGAWLLLFFLVPIVFLASVSLQTGNIFDGFKLTWHFHNYIDAVQRYRVQFVRSLEYAFIATAVTLLVSYPLSYWIAFRGGRHKTTFLFLLLLPFFVSFVIRTLAWQFILSDDGILFGTLKSWHVLPESFHVLATRTAVISGIAYNFLPFMALPLYVSLERID